MVVLNACNLGFGYTGDGRFTWEGVRQAVRYYEERGVAVQAVCKFRTAKLSPVPEDLKAVTVVCPIIDQQPDADDLFGIRLAMDHSCQLVDNDNYRDWKYKEDMWCSDEDLRNWLTTAEGTLLKVNYVFDCSGKFIPSVPPPTAAPANHCTAPADRWPGSPVAA